MGTTMQEREQDTGITMTPHLTPIADIPLDQLVDDITYEHRQAEKHMTASLTHARAAGVKLLEAKRRPEVRGHFKAWVKETCGFTYPTAALYMRVAKQWQRVERDNAVIPLTLRDAAKLLAMDENEDYATAAAHVVDLGLLEWSDLNGLSPIESRSLVSETQKAYEDFCSEVDAEVQAQRDALPVDAKGNPGHNPKLTCNRGALRTWAREAAADLKTGKISFAGVQKRVRSDARVISPKKTTAEVERETKENNERAEKEKKAGRTWRPPAAPVVIERVTYLDRVQRFIDATRAVTTPEGFHEERVTHLLDFLPDADRHEARGTGYSTAVKKKFFEVRRVMEGLERAMDVAEQVASEALQQRLDEERTAEAQADEQYRQMQEAGIAPPDAPGEESAL